MAKKKDPEQITPAASVISSATDLTPDMRNANKGTERGVTLLEKSLTNYGAGRSILCDRHGNVIAGNKTLEAAQSIGLENIQVVRTDGTSLVVVQRTDLDIDSRAARELAIADNRTSEISLSWDTEALKVLQEDGVRLEEFWFDDELAKLLGDGELKPTPGAQAVKEQFAIMITCTSETQQTELLNRLCAEGLQCKALAA